MKNRDKKHRRDMGDGNRLPDPPVTAAWFLSWFLRVELLEEVEGDLAEQFHSRLKNGSLTLARLNYWYQVLNYLRPFAIRKLRIGQQNHYTMFQNDLKIGWRNLTRQKMYSTIKIGGFALGIATCILIALFIRDELSYDRTYPNAGRIFRIVGEYHDEGDISRGTDFPAPFAGVLKDEFPEIEKTARFMPHHLFDGAGSNQIRPGGKTENSYEEGFAYTDQEMLDILEWDMIYGDPKKALSEPKSMVVTRRIAEKYFPGENPVGKTLILNDDTDQLYTIGGVIEDHPATSHIQFDFLISLENHEFWEGEQTSWRANNYYTYILLRPDADPLEVEEKFSVITDKYVIPNLPESMREEIPKIKDGIKFSLQPISDIHLKSIGIEDRFEHGDIRIVWMFGIVAVFILLLAIINFINLSTARSANRAREVGIRKVVGSVRGNLIKQFLTESVLFSIMSFCLGLILAWILLPYFNVLSDKSLSFPWQQWRLYPLVLLMALLIGLLAGLYPSIYLSSFKPITVLKGVVSRGSQGTMLRSTLVVIQFTASIILIIGTFIIQRQMNYILNKNLGFDKNQVMILEGTGTLGEQTLTFKEELLDISGVESVSTSDFLPVSGTKRNQNGYGVNRGDNPVWAQAWWGDPDYIKTMGMKIVHGRDFSKERSSDQQSVIINETLARELDLEDPVGQRIFRNDTELTVIGVMEDFHFETMKDEVDGLGLHLGGDRSNHISLRLTGSDFHGLIRSVSTVWGKFMPNQPIRYAFLDERFANMYDGVIRTEKIFTSFAILAVIIACLGLFALSAFMTEQRAREISIRLVLGASVNGIFRLLTQDFVLLVVISFIIAAPIAWYIMQKWLEDYVYRIKIGWDVFFMAGLIAIIIALITIGYQAVKASVMNPVNNLRSE
jgi:putative ABC transport system permease protein